MSRISPVSNPTGQAADLLDTLRTNIGKDLNIFTTMAHAPAALKSYMDFSGNLKNGALDAKLREAIALTCANFNGCDYCASAHTAIGAGAGLSEDALAQALKGKSNDDKTQAALTFTTVLLKKRGQVNDNDVSALKQAGYSDQELIEIVANVSLNIFTNYFNDVALTAIDFPEVKTSGGCCGGNDKAEDTCCAA